MPYRAPDLRERNALLQFLKEASSLTGWRRAVGYHEILVDLVKACRGAPAEDGQVGGDALISQSDLVGFLNNHGCLKVALMRLEEGDRGAFKFRLARGHFIEGETYVHAWRDELGRYLYGGGADFPPHRHPRWGELERAMTSSIEAFAEVNPVLQLRHRDVPAPMFDIDAWAKGRSPAFMLRFNKVHAEVIPIPEPVRLVETGEPITHFGIWEPVKRPPQPGVLNRIFGGGASADDPLAVDGCMNYLHKGEPAPTIAFPEDGQRREGRPTLWRLMWIDERYGEKGIPEEEASYVFNLPKGGPDSVEPQPPRP